MPLVARRLIFALLMAAGVAGPAAAQTPYTWTGSAGDNNWFTTNNWAPTGSPGGSNGNTDQALFGTAGTVATASGLNGGFDLGAIATTGASGGTLAVTFSGSSSLTLNGGYSAGGFNNVVAAAQNGRDLVIASIDMGLKLGSGAPTQFYADAGRTLSLSVKQLNTNGATFNKVGPGTMVLSQADSSGILPLGGTSINVAAGVLASRQLWNNVGQINVATAARLQAGLTAGDTLNAATNVSFANNAALQVVTDGTSVSQLQGNLTKDAADAFRIVLTGLSTPGSYTPGGAIIQSSSLSGFDPDGFYNQASPGHFAVSGDGVTVGNWSLTVSGGNITLNSFSLTPVPEPATALGAGAAGLTLVGWARRRQGR